MTPLVQRAMQVWGLEGAAAHLVARRENAVYRIEHAGRSYAMRLHRAHYRTDAELRSELVWMEALRKGGVSVPTPVPARSGALLQTVDGVQVDVLDWLQGETLDTALERASPVARLRLFEQIGRQMAHLHEVCDLWQPPSGFTRARWDSDGLLGAAPLWDRFWENPALTHPQRAMFTQFRTDAGRALAALGPDADTGLIHADLVAGNVMLDGAHMHLIDFDDGGTGYRLFDVATALFKHMDAADYSDLKRALLAGYAARRALNTEALDLFMALRGVTYVGWNITRAGEDASGARGARFIAQAERAVRRFYEGSCHR